MPDRDPGQICNCQNSGEKFSRSDIPRGLYKIRNSASIFQPILQKGRH
jgi:hypothetical protein